ncbi:MAG: hypothetical protein Ct9H300mP1_06150 [Planctomycetaceae bacterium]|nr:MAG: hypothetical protein Ct9H300mP1_06150 [Planctomycetaceae bacterium]
MEAEVIRDSVLLLAGNWTPRSADRCVEYPLRNDPSAKPVLRGVSGGGGQHAFAELFDPPGPCDCFRRSSTVVPSRRWR